MSGLEKIRTLRISKWIIYIFLGIIALFVIDRLIGTYYQIKTVNIEEQTRETLQRQQNKLVSDELYYNKVDSLANLNKHNEAIKLSELRMVKYPDDKAYLTRHIGNIYYHKGDIDSAIIKYTEAISLTNMYISAYVDRGWAYMELDSINLAIKDFDFASSHNWDFYFDLGIAQERKGLLKSAIQSYNKYLEHYPDNQECLIKRDSINELIKNGLQQ
jgi:tetratricopeptide (TPR) repeat protein